MPQNRPGALETRLRPPKKRSKIRPPPKKNFQIFLGPAIGPTLETLKRGQSATHRTSEPVAWQGGKSWLEPDDAVHSLRMAHGGRRPKVRWKIPDG